MNNFNKGKSTDSNKIAKGTTKGLADQQNGADEPSQAGAGDGENKRFVRAEVRKNGSKTAKGRNQGMERVVKEGKLNPGVSYPTPHIISLPHLSTKKPLSSFNDDGLESLRSMRSGGSSLRGSRRDKFGRQKKSGSGFQKSQINEKPEGEEEDGKDEDLKVGQREEDKGKPRKEPKDSSKSSKRSRKKGSKSGRKKGRKESRKGSKRDSTPDRLPRVDTAGYQTERTGYGGGDTARGLITDRDGRNLEGIEAELRQQQQALGLDDRTFEEKIKDLEQRSSLMNWITMLSIVLSSSFFGYYISIATVIARPLIVDVYNYTEEEVTQYTGQLGSLFALGVMLSNFLVPLFTKHVGRIRTLLLCEVIKLVIIFSFSVERIDVFLVMRFLTGIIAGFDTTVVPIVCSEFLPPNLAATGGAMGYSVVTIFMIAAGLMDFIFDGREGLAQNYRLILTWPIVLTFFILGFLLMTLGLSDTPDFYIENFSEDEETLKEKITHCMNTIYTKRSAKRYAQYRIEELRAVKMEEIAKKRRQGEDGKNAEISMNLKTMCGERWRKQFLVVLGLNMCQQMSGIGFMTYFSTQVFDDLSGNGPLMTSLLGIGNFVGSIVALLVIDFGRRSGQLLGSFFHGIAIAGLLVGVGIKNQWILGASLILYIITFACSMGSIFVVYCVEVVPPFGVGVSFGFQWLFSAIIGLVAPVLVKKYGFLNMIVVLFFGNLIYFGYVWAFCYEIKGYTQEEIRILFKNGGKYLKKMKEKEEKEEDENGEPGQVAAN